MTSVYQGLTEYLIGQKLHKGRRKEAEGTAPTLRGFHRGEQNGVQNSHGAKKTVTMLCKKGLKSGAGHREEQRDLSVVSEADFIRT